MLRNEIQEKTGLTRKAIVLYQKDDRNISLYITIGKDNYEEKYFNTIYYFKYLIFDGLYPKRS